MKSARLPTGSTTAAASLMGLQALVTVVMAFAFLTVRPRARLPLFESSLADSRDELAVGLVFAAFALCLLAFGVASLEGWARIGAIAAEAFIIVASLVRFPVHLVWTLAAVAVSMTGNASAASRQRMGRQARPLGTRGGIGPDAGQRRAGSYALRLRVAQDIWERSNAASNGFRKRTRSIIGCPRTSSVRTVPILLSLAVAHMSPSQYDI